MVQQRAEFRREVAALAPADQVVVDESGVTTSLTRLYGRAPKGARVVDRVPGGRWETVTVLGALTPNGILAAMTVPSATDGDVFRAYVHEVLVPALRPGQAVMMDNLGAHKVAGVREAIEAAGCRLLYLPPYSPDLSPIEPAWSKMKARLRAAKHRTRDALERGVGAALAAITPQDAHGFFKDCEDAV